MNYNKISKIKMEIIHNDKDKETYKILINHNQQFNNKWVNKINKDIDKDNK